MAVEQDLGQNRHSTRRWLTRGAGVVLTVAGGGISAGAGYDYVVNALPAETRFTEELDERYHLLSVRELQTANDNIAAFEDQLERLIIDEQAVQIPQLVENTEITDSYTELNKHKENIETRNRLRAEKGSSRSAIDILAMVSGFIPLIVGVQLALRKGRSSKE